MKRNRRLVLFVIPYLFSSCSNTINSARQAVTATQNFQVDVIDSLVKIDAEIQLAIAHNAATKEEGTKKLAAYYEKRAKVRAVILEAKAITALGPALIAMVEAGIKPKQDLETWLIALWQSAKQVREAIAELSLAAGGGTP